MFFANVWWIARETQPCERHCRKSFYICSENSMNNGYSENFLQNQSNDEWKWVKVQCCFAWLVETILFGELRMLTHPLPATRSSTSGSVVLSYLRPASQPRLTMAGSRHVSCLLPRCSMYGILTYIYPINHSNVDRYSIHGASGLDWIKT